MGSSPLFCIKIIPDKPVCLQKYLKVHCLKIYLPASLPYSNSYPDSFRSLLRMLPEPHHGNHG